MTPIHPILRTIIGNSIKREILIRKIYPPAFSGNEHHSSVAGLLLDYPRYLTVPIAVSSSPLSGVDLFPLEVVTDRFTLLHVDLTVGARVLCRVTRPLGEIRAMAWNRFSFPAQRMERPMCAGMVLHLEHGSPLSRLLLARPLSGRVEPSYRTCVVATTTPGHRKPDAVNPIVCA